MIDFLMVAIRKKYFEFDLFNINYRSLLYFEYNFEDREVMAFELFFIVII